MSGAVRLPSGGEIDRARPLAFRFDGGEYAGFAGDTVASALLAAGARVVGRSFKYHRPRGLMAAFHEEPNAILDLRHGERHDPNARATLEPLCDGMHLRSVHAVGSARHDAFAFMDRLWRFIPAAFYYKTFLWPRWKLYEGAIRRMAGLGRVDPHDRAVGAAHRQIRVDLCVIGAGPAGLAAARAGLRSGRSVLLVEGRPRVGGSLLWSDALVDGESGAGWAAGVRAELERGGATVLASTIALGLYDHNALVLVQRGEGGERIWRVRAGDVVLATGAVERPLLFGDNDRPGVMLADAALEYLRRYAVRAGSRMVFATNNDSAYAAARAHAANGAHCTVVDARADSAFARAARDAGIAVHTGERIERAFGTHRVTGVRLASGTRLDADLVAVSGGWTPMIHLWCQARGRPRWDDAIGALVPGDAIEGVRVVGSANGARTLQDAIGQGQRAGGDDTGAPPRALESAFGWGGAPDTSMAFGARRAWVDLQHDVTAKDVRLAVRENFRAVEHLKRYTTLGMANDQGKTSNINGLALLAEASERAIADVGITTFRPPFVPVSMAAVTGTDRGELQHPLRRLPLENTHRAEGACLFEYGNLLRPAWYGDAAGAIERECRAARESCVVLDASSLGKIEVLGADAAALLDFVFYTRMSTLAVGRLRYGLALAESGAILDDAVVMRLGASHFVVSCSSGHVESMVAHLEAWREDRFALGRVFIHDTTAHWATLAISGPQSGRVLAALHTGADPDDAVLPHMGMHHAEFESLPARIARVSFTGERSYEVSVPARLAAGLWQRARAAGAQPLGVEALGVLRCEKGFIYVGQDTDSETQPQDIGFGQARLRREDAYVGDRSLFTPAARRESRRQLVGVIAEGALPLPVGAHAVDASGGRLRSIGFVTSSYPSLALGRPVALALIEGGAGRHGERLEFEHMGRRVGGTLAAPCALDPGGERLNA